MEIYHDRVRDSCGNFADNASARICTISDDHDLHRTPDVSKVKNRLGQIHFLPCGNEHGCVEDFPTNLINRPVTITDFCNTAPGAVKTLFHILTTFRTNQQSFIKPTRRTND